MANNPCNRFVKLDIGEQPVVRRALTLEEQKRLVSALEGEITGFSSFSCSSRD